MVPNGWQTEFLKYYIHMTLGTLNICKKEKEMKLEFCIYDYSLSSLIYWIAKYQTHFWEYVQEKRRSWSITHGAEHGCGGGVLRVKYPPWDLIFFNISYKGSWLEKLYPYSVIPIIILEKQDGI